VQLITVQASCRSCSTASCDSHASQLFETHSHVLEYCCEATSHTPLFRLWYEKVVVHSWLCAFAVVSLTSPIACARMLAIYFTSHYNAAIVYTLCSAAHDWCHAIAVCDACGAHSRNAVRRS
jgi:hypothetical protein